MATQKKFPKPAQSKAKEEATTYSVKAAKRSKVKKEEAAYFGCRVQQRKSKVPAMFAFVARVREIEQWAGIRRVQDTRKGTQRVHRPSRSRAIKRFLEASSTNTIPNNLLLAFLPGIAKFTPVDLMSCADGEDLENRCGTRLEWGVLSFSYIPGVPEPDRPALVVDGQHRLRGIASYEDDLPVFAIALLDASVEEQAFQFIVINNKSARVPSDNVKAIIANMNEEQVRDRLLLAGVSYGKTTPALKDADTLKASPFKGLLAWPNNEEDARVVPVTAIEQMLRYISTVFAAEFEADEDSPLELLFAMWNVLSSQYAPLWGPVAVETEGAAKFMSKVNLSALNEFVVDRLKVLWEMGYVDLFDEDELEEKVKEIVSRLPIEFWQTEWEKLADNAAFKHLLKRDLEVVTENVRKKKPWYENLKILQEEMST